jgi:hypothetical protein
MAHEFPCDRVNSDKFRERLIELVIATAYARDPMTDDKIDEVAKLIGVDPEVLIEARVRYRLQRRRDGYQIPLGQKKRGSRHHQLFCEMPREVFEAWRREAERRAVLPSALLRSIVQAYLLGSYEPPELLRHWYWRGRVVAIEPYAEKKQRVGGYPYREVALITQGSWRALRLRAERRGHGAAAIVRALVLEIVDGKHERLRLIDAQSMYDDETRYRTEPGPVNLLPGSLESRSTK